MHRRNSVESLMSTPVNFGIEVDIRSQGARLIIDHDPYLSGEDFEDWLLAYQHGTLILNVKEDGLEARLIELMKQRGIHRYFFLDQSFPSMIQWSRRGEHRCAVRMSEYESIETVIALTGKVDWVWIDCFTKFSLNKNDAIRLDEAGFKICLVSPELQGRNAEVEIPLLAKVLAQDSIIPSAICTKRPDLWETEIAVK